MSAPDIFDELAERDVALFDELPLWSSLAGQLLLEHVQLTARNFVRFGFRPGWEEVAAGPETMARLSLELDRVAGEAGELRLTVPLAYIEARRA